MDIMIQAYLFVFSRVYKHKKEIKYVSLVFEIERYFLSDGIYNLMSNAISLQTNEPCFWCICKRRMFFTWQNIFLAYSMGHTKI